MDNETRERIEKEARNYALTKGYVNGVQIKWCELDYTSGATAEHSRITELLKEERSKVIDEVLEKVQIKFYNTPRNKDMVEALDTCLDVIRSLKGKQQ